MTVAKRKTYGKTASGVPITDELVVELAERVEAGYDVDEILRRRGGRPPDRLRGRERRVRAARS
jgi:hypothetical protein